MTNYSEILIQLLVRKQQLRCIIIDLTYSSSLCFSLTRYFNLFTAFRRSVNCSCCGAALALYTFPSG